MFFSKNEARPGFLKYNKNDSLGNAATDSLKNASDILRSIIKAGEFKGKPLIIMIRGSLFRIVRPESVFIQIPAFFFGELI